MLQESIYFYAYTVRTAAMKSVSLTNVGLGRGGYDYACSAHRILLVETMSRAPIPFIILVNGVRIALTVLKQIYRYCR